MPFQFSGDIVAQADSFRGFESAGHSYLGHCDTILFDKKVTTVPAVTVCVVKCEGVLALVRTVADLCVGLSGNPQGMIATAVTSDINVVEGSRG